MAVASTVFCILSPVFCIPYSISNKHRAAVDVDYKPG